MQPAYSGVDFANMVAAAADMPAFAVNLVKLGVLGLAKAGTTLGVILGEDIAITAKINATDFTLTKTVENHLNDYNKLGDKVRPCADSRALMQEIIDSAVPVINPRGVPGALRWDAPGTMNGSKGVYELVIDPKTNTILHFLFKGGQ